MLHHYKMHPVDYFKPKDASMNCARKTLLYRSDFEGIWTFLTEICVENENNQGKISLLFQNPIGRGTQVIHHHRPRKGRIARVLHGFSVTRADQDAALHAGVPSAFQI